MTITEFLLARIAEDETVAKAAAEHGAEWSQPDPERAPGLIESEGAVIVYDEGSPTQADAAHITRHDPERVLAECEAKRRIVGTLGGFFGLDNFSAGLVDFTLNALALPYADHPDYDEEWRP